MNRVTTSVASAVPVSDMYVLCGPCLVSSHGWAFVLRPRLASGVLPMLERLPLHEDSGSRSQPSII